MEIFDKSSFFIAYYRAATALNSSLHLAFGRGCAR